MKKQTVKSFMSWALTLALLVTAMPLSLIAAADTGVDSAVAVLTENTTEFLGGDGSEKKPYLISNKRHLNNVRNYPDAHFKMLIDIVFIESDFAEGGDFYNNGKGFEPIGSDYYSIFDGVFDGNGHTIKGLYINSKDNYAGMFGYNAGTVKNLGLIESKISASLTNSYSYAGGIAGYNRGTINNCYNTGSVSASSKVASSYTSGSNSYAGAIAGYNDEGIISNCYSIGSISALADDSYSNYYSFAYAGGIVGYNAGDFNYTIISNCYNMGSVSAISRDYSYAGGIAGLNRFSTISNCYNIGNVSASTRDSYAGGITGENSGTISNCYNTGNVSASIHSFNRPYAGGIVGDNSSTISNCYYLDIVLQGVGLGTDTAVKCTLEEMKKQDTFVGFDFESIWEMRKGNSYPFPTLRELPYTDTSKENLTDFAGGTGFSHNPYIIKTKAHLNNVRKFLNANFKMAEDIEFTEQDFSDGGAFYNNGKGWEPIGEDSETSFMGVFDGNGHTIKGLYIDSKDEFAGLFGYNIGTIKNLELSGSSICITNSDSNSHVYDNIYAGGIVGYNYYGTISNCYGKDIISVSSSTNSYVGEIAGYNRYGIIDNCHSTGIVSSSALSPSSNFVTSAYAGGIVGYNGEGTINNCYNTGSVSASPFYYNSSAYAGGIAGGINYGAISNCYNTGSITSDCAGGITGINYGTISKCYNTGSVSASLSYSSSSAGGIVGFNSSTINDCYNTGSVSSSAKYGSYAGGIVGDNSSTISNCYNTGSVSASSSYSSSSAGGIVGDNSSTISNCYYPDIILKGVGSGADTAIKCTLEEMKQPKTFVGFDFHTVWEIDEFSNYLYPQLINNRQEQIQNIEILSAPENIKVIEGVYPDLSAVKVKITYADGFEVTAGATNQMLSELNINQIGIQTVHLTYGGQVTDEAIEIEVLPKSVSSIDVTKLPDKITYVQGQPINPAGGELTVYYNNNTSETVFLSDAQLSYPPERTGAVTATAEYYGFTADFSITVNEKQIKSMSIFEPTKLIYIEGQMLDLTGGKLLVTYVSEDNYTEEIPLNSSMVTGFDPYLLDIQVLTVNYLDQSTNFVVRVVAKSLSEIEVIKKPDKLYYLEAKDALNVTGGKIALVYNNGTSEEINMTYDMVSGFNNTITGTQTLTVTYDGKQAFFDITIISVPLPVPKLVSKTATSVTLEDFEGFEYSIDGIDWQDEPVFTGLRPETEYSFYQRIKATDNSDASPSSPVLKVTTESALVKGDINGDGSVDIRDLVRLKKMASSGGYSHSADLIPDDVINALDLAEMREYLLGVKIYF